MNLFDGNMLTFPALISVVVITPNLRTFPPLTEEAAGAGGHDGPFILPSQAHPEDQQVQPPAAGHSGSGWFIQAKRRDPGYTARYKCLRTKCVWPSGICA